jgi:hypothetical protein
MHRVDLTRRTETGLAAIPDDVHEEALALIDDVAADRLPATELWPEPMP